MRILIATMNQAMNQQVAWHLEQRFDTWKILTMTDGKETLAYLFTHQVDILVLHVCLPQVDGAQLLKALWNECPIAPPRILFLCQAEIAMQFKDQVDCIAHLHTTAVQLCALLELLSKKPLPKLEVVHRKQIADMTHALLDALMLRKSLKGYPYASWILCRLIASPSTLDQPMSRLYQACADAFQTSSCAVERCLRVAVESIFTQGSLQNIENVFGATIDPERGKPTNRAFLCQATQRLTQTLTLWQKHAR